MGKKRKQPRKGSLLTKHFVVSVFSLLGVIFASGFYIFDTVYAYVEEFNAPISMKLDPNIGVKDYVTEFFINNDADNTITF